MGKLPCQITPKEAWQELAPRKVTGPTENHEIEGLDRDDLHSHEQDFP
jgi:hypothetical protein